jgi:hypothetical protein
MAEQIGIFAINSSGVESYDVMFWPNQGEEGYRICKAKTLEQLINVMHAVGCPLTDVQIELGRGHKWIGGFGVRAVKTDILDLYFSK